METRTTRTLMMGLVFGSALLLAACNSVSVAVVVPLTREHEAYGTSIRKGIDLAYQEIKADPSMKPEIRSLDVLDSNSDPKKAAKLLEKAYNGGAAAAIGGVTSAEAKEMIPVADKYATLLLSPSASSPELSGISKNFFRIWPSDQAEAAKMAQSAVSDLGIKTLVVIAEQQIYARGAQNAFKPAFESRGGKILQSFEYPVNTRDVSGMALQVIELKPDAVYVVDFADGIAAWVTELRRHQYPGKILTTSAFSSPATINRIGNDAAGVMMTQTIFDPGSDKTLVRKFVEAYKAKYKGETPDIYAAHGYDAMKLVAAALKGREPEKADLLAGLRSDAVKGFLGVSGPIEFDEKGDVKQLPHLYMIGNDLVPIEYTAEVRDAMLAIEGARKAPTPPAGTGN